MKVKDILKLYEPDGKIFIEDIKWKVLHDGYAIDTPEETKNKVIIEIAAGMHALCLVVKE